MARLGFLHFECMFPQRVFAVQQTFVRGNCPRCRLQIIFFTLVWPMFFSYCRLLGWNVVRSGTLPGFLPKLSSLLPAEKSKPWARENPPQISRPAGPGSQGLRRTCLFLDEANLFLYRSGDPLLIGPHGGIPHIWNYLRSRLWTEGVRNWSRSLPNTMRTSSSYIARIV